MPNRHKDRDQAYPCYVPQCPKCGSLAVSTASGAVIMESVD